MRGTFAGNAQYGIVGLDAPQPYDFFHRLGYFELKITDPRIPIIISVLALAVATFQTWFANEANSFNKEKITIEASSSDNPSARIGPTKCWNDEVTAITLNWRVTIFNNSTQAITIKKLSSIATSPAGPIASTTVFANGPTNREFPVLIEAKNFKTFQVALPTRASPEFAKWFKENGGCTGKPIWPTAVAREQFDETGWTGHGRSGAMFTAVSGGGGEFFIQAVWR
jgi:hypothetical protein